MTAETGEGGIDEGGENISGSRDGLIGKCGEVVGGCSGVMVFVVFVL